VTVTGAVEKNRRHQSGEAKANKNSHLHLAAKIFSPRFLAQASSAGDVALVWYMIARVKYVVSRESCRAIRPLS